MTHDDQDTESIGSSKNSLATAGIHEEPATAANRGHFINSTTIITIHHHHHPPSSPSPPSLSPPSLSPPSSSPSTRSLPPQQQIEVIFHLSGMHFSFSRKIWYIYQYRWCCFLIKWTLSKWLGFKATSTKTFDATWWSRFASKASRAIWEQMMQILFGRWRVDSKYV